MQVGFIESQLRRLNLLLDQNEQIFGSYERQNIRIIKMNNVPINQEKFYYI